MDHAFHSEPKVKMNLSKILQMLDDPNLVNSPSEQSGKTPSHLIFVVHGMGNQW